MLLAPTAPRNCAFTFPLLYAPPFPPRHEKHVL